MPPPLEGSGAIAWTSDSRRRDGPCVFVDRDGVINERIVDGYVLRWDQFRWRPDALQALRILTGAGMPVIVASNQSCVGRGLLTIEGLLEIMARMEAHLAENGIPLAGWYACPHAPDAGCDCRKPKPGMLRRAARELGCDLSRSWMIGDSPSDTAAGEAAGCTALLIDPTAHDAFETAALAIVREIRPAR